jgi:hypothetical protein
MMTNCNAVPTANLASTAKSHFNLKRFLGLGLILLVWLIISFTARAAEGTTTDQYQHVIDLITQADSLTEKGKVDLAKRTYNEAQTALLDFKKNNPNWNEAMVSFRLEYLNAKINPPPAPVPAVVAAPKPEQKLTPKPVTKAVAAPSVSAVKLISAGAEPRKELRIHPKAGDKQNLEMTMKMAMDMGTGQTMKMPAMKTAMEVTVKSISANGDINYAMLIANVEVLDEPGAMPQIVESMKASLNGMKGLSMTGTISDHGITKSLDVKIPAGAAPQMRQAMEQMKESVANTSLPFPDEAVGVGAKWEVKLPVKTQGMTIDQTTTYELVSLKNDQANVTSTIIQNAANQKITNPAMPQMKMELIKMDGKGSANVTFDLTRFLPTLATVDSHSDTSMGVNAGGKVQEMAMKMDMNMRMEAK